MRGPSVDELVLATITAWLAYGDDPERNEVVALLQELTRRPDRYDVILALVSLAGDLVRMIAALEPLEERRENPYRLLQDVAIRVAQRQEV